MKLVELLARELEEWPEGAQTAIQDPDRDNTIWYQKIDHAPLYFEYGAWRGGSWFEVLISEPSARSDDYESAMISRAQWQAERDRQKGGEWKRHRGGKQPVDAGQRVGYKLRNGDQDECLAGHLMWDHQKDESDVMQYRIISQPQAEEVEVRDTNIGTISYTISVDQIAGPLAWRDTIIHCQAIIEDCEREIERNVQLLDAEGLMMQIDSKKAMQHYAVPLIAPEDWQIGDILEIVKRSDANSHDFKIGEHVKIDFFDADDEDLPVRCYALDDSDYWYIKYDEAKFVRRP